MVVPMKITKTNGVINIHVHGGRKANLLTKFI